MKRETASLYVDLENKFHWIKREIYENHNE